MKAYTLWLRSGQCIEGKLTNEQEQAFRDALTTHTRAELTDTDGLLFFHPDDITAAALTEIAEDPPRIRGFAG